MINMQIRYYPGLDILIDCILPFKRASGFKIKKLPYFYGSF